MYNKGKAAPNALVQPPPNLNPFPHFFPIPHVSFDTRKHSLSADQSVRVTVDWDMTFHMCSPITRDVGAGEFRDDRVIVEVKYGVDRESEIDRLTAALPFRLSRYSKYVTGVSEASFRVV